MKKCRYCGADMEDTAIFCSRCGKQAGDENGPFETGGGFRQEDFRSTYQGYYREPVRYNGMAVASLVLGVLSAFMNGLYFVPSILAIIFGALGKSQISRDPSQGGRGMAAAGMILGIIFLAVYVLLLIAVIQFYREFRLNIDWGELFDVFEHL